METRIMLNIRFGKTEICGDITKNSIEEVNTAIWAAFHTLKADEVKLIRNDY